MRLEVLTGSLTVALCLVALPTPAAARQTRPETSPVLVKQLVTMMAARQVDAVATVDPDEPGRLIGALIVGDQLMVISSRHKASEYLELQIGKRQFRDVYMSLQDGIAEGRLFFHDLGCDGFGSGDLDIFYEGAKGRTLLDGNWLAQGITEPEYAEKRRGAEEKYVKALTALIEAARKLPIIT
jgi:hypothetical protein